MTPSLNELIGRDIAQLNTDLDILRQRIAALAAIQSAGHALEDGHFPLIATHAAEVAADIQRRLTEIGLQAGAAVPSDIPLGSLA